MPCLNSGLGSLFSLPATAAVVGTMDHQNFTLEERRMSERFRGHRLLWLCAGVVLGLVVSSFSPVKPLHAVATDRQDTLAICTCELAGGIEGVFTLDFLTGELRGTVLNATTRQFNLGYVANCAEHLRSNKVRRPSS